MKDYSTASQHLRIARGLLNERGEGNGGERTGTRAWEGGKSYIYTYLYESLCQWAMGQFHEAMELSSLASQIRGVNGKQFIDSFLLLSYYYLYYIKDNTQCTYYINKILLREPLNRDALQLSFRIEFKQRKYNKSIGILNKLIPFLEKKVKSPNKSPSPSPSPLSSPANHLHLIDLYQSKAYCLIKFSYGTTDKWKEYMENRKKQHILALKEIDLAIGILKKLAKYSSPSSPTSSPSSLSSSPSASSASLSPFLSFSSPSLLREFIIYKHKQLDIIKNYLNIIINIPITIIYWEKEKREGKGKTLSFAPIEGEYEIVKGKIIGERREEEGEIEGNNPPVSLLQLVDGHIDFPSLSSSFSLTEREDRIEQSPFYSYLYYLEQNKLKEKYLERIKRKERERGTGDRKKGEDEQEQELRGILFGGKDNLPKELLVRREGERGDGDQGEEEKEEGNNTTSPLLPSPSSSSSALFYSAIEEAQLGSFLYNKVSIPIGEREKKHKHFIHILTDQLNIPLPRCLSAIQQRIIEEDIVKEDIGGKEGKGGEGEEEGEGQEENKRLNLVLHALFPLNEDYFLVYYYLKGKRIGKIDHIPWAKERTRERIEREKERMKIKEEEERRRREEEEIRKKEEEQKKEEEEKRRREEEEERQRKEEEMREKENMILSSLPLSPSPTPSSPSIQSEEISKLLLSKLIEREREYEEMKGELNRLKREKEEGEKIRLDEKQMERESREEEERKRKEIEGKAKDQANQREIQLEIEQQEETNDHVETKEQEEKIEINGQEEEKVLEMNELQETDENKEREEEEREHSAEVDEGEMKEDAASASISSPPFVIIIQGPDEQEGRREEKVEGKKEEDKEREEIEMKKEEVGNEKEETEEKKEKVENKEEETEEYEEDAEFHEVEEYDEDFEKEGEAEGKERDEEEGREEETEIKKEQKEKEEEKKDIITSTASTSFPSSSSAAIPSPVPSSASVSITNISHSSSSISPSPSPSPLPAPPASSPKPKLILSLKKKSNVPPPPRPAPLPSRSNELSDEQIIAAAMKKFNMKSMDQL